MAVYQLPNITKDVRITLDLNSNSDALVEIEDVDTLSIDEIIQSKVLDAVIRVHSQAPYYLLDGGNNFGDSIVWGDLQNGHILLPEDFMRLAVFKMSDWAHAVYQAITTDNPIYAQQSSRFKGVRGTSQNPICAIALQPEGRTLEFFSCDSVDATVTRGVYIAYPEIDKDNGVEICEKCYNAVVYTIASLVASTLGNMDKSASLLELANNSLL